MKPNVSDHQFLEGDDIIVVQTSTTADYEKGDTKNVRVESLREDIRNYVESTTTKELKVFTSNRSVGGGRLDVLNNETLYYYPATPVSSLNDADISLTSNGDFFTDIDNQKEFNEKIYGFANDINLTLENSNKYLDAIVASTEFDDPDDPTEVVHFTNYNAYTTPNTDKAEVVNKNDLTYVDEESNKRDNDLQEQLDDQERRITALFNVKVDSGYYVHSTADPETTLPGPGQLHIDLTSNDVDPVTFSLHARSYTALYVGDEDPDNAQTTNNYIVVNPNDTIVTTNRTYKVVSVTVVDVFNNFY